MIIHVSNISFHAKEEDIQQVFAAHGEVSSVKIIRNRETGRSKGYAFVEMAGGAEGLAAIAALNGTELNGRPLKVAEAKSSGESVS